jgi:phosphoglycerol transferase MdoB-like AlkP superfamily enzyme
MSDRGVEQGTAQAHLAPERAVGLTWPWRVHLPPAAAWALASVPTLLTGLYFVDAEGDPGNILFTAAVTLTIAAVIVLASRRVLFAAVLTTALVVGVRTAAYVKQQTDELVLHAYEVVTLATSWSAAVGFWTDYRGFAVMLVAALAATAVAGWMVWRVDGTRIRRLHAAVAVLVLACLAVAGAAVRGERRHTEIYFESMYVSFFYASWAETIEALWRGHLIEAAARSQQPDLAAPADCAPAHKPPHIILIHQESVVPPGYFPTLEYDRSLDRFFQSADGTQRKLRVETFGGASWLSEFSVLTGLSSQSFRGMQQFVQPFMTGRLGDTLPRALARCGYRSVMFYPMLRSFVNSGKFFSHVGFEKVYDASDQGAKLHNERDRFYYANALAALERHVRISQAPLFVFLETMATHGAYDYKYMPEVDVPGGGPGTHPEVHEYLRRLAMARIDYMDLRRELARRFPGQEFLLVHYGDHQPSAARTLHGFDVEDNFEEVMRRAGPAQLATYYALDGVRYRLPPLPALAGIDIPYLGTVILEAAGLPLSDIYRERKRLMLLCEGRYHDCPAREEILAFHRRLINAGLLDAR